MSHKNNDELNLLMMDYINNKMTAADRLEFETMLATAPEASQELAELRQMMTLVEQRGEQGLPEPSARMDERFYAMLDQQVLQDQQEQAAEITNSPGMMSRFWQWFSLPQAQKLAYGMGFLVVGLFVGHYAHLLKQQDELVAERLLIKDQQIQALTVLSLLDMPSANKRIMAVNLAGMSKQPNQQILDALLTTLQQDSNVNVRLEALEVLASHANNPQVRQGLLQSIKQQQSPMVQIAMADLMRQLNETRAVEPLREMIEQQDLIEPVRTELNDTVNELI